MGERNLARQAERQLERHGDYDSLWFEGAWHSTGRSADQAARLATGLTRLGMRPGDRVVVLMANCPEVLVSYNALWRAGAVATPLIFLVSVEELRHALADSGAVGVITTREFLPKVIAALEGAPDVRFVVVAGGAADNDATNAADTADTPVLDFDELVTDEPGRIVDRGDDDLAALLYTGGTTGRSKGVPLTHANLYWCGSTTQQSTYRSDLNVNLLPLPLAHAYGLLVTCSGMHNPEPSRTVLMRWFDAAGWVDLCERHRVRRSSLVPSMFQMLLAQPLEEADLSHLVTVSSGAAALAERTRVEFEKRVPGVTICEGYGCTESASIVSSNPLDARRPGSVGLPVPGCEVTIRDDDDTELPSGADGEICVRSPGVMSGYWRAGDRTAETVVGGWLRTGDIGHLDADGYLYLVDRKKDLIIRGGFNVYPRDVEDALLRHPAVGQAAAVGRPDQRLGEEVVAFVALREGETTTGDDLLQHAKSHLAANKYPREIRIVPAVPLTNVGKVDRKRLRAQLREQAGA